MGEQEEHSLAVGEQEEHSLPVGEQEEQDIMLRPVGSSKEEEREEPKKQVAGVIEIIDKRHFDVPH